MAGDTRFDDIKIVGAVQNGRQRKILVLAANKGAIVKPGDCVGREHVPFERILQRVPAPPPPPPPPPAAPRMA